MKIRRWTGTFSAALFLGAMLLAGCERPAPLTPLVTDKFISPRPLSRQDVGNMPMNLLATPDGRFALVSDMGYRQALWSIRLADGQGVSHIDFLNPPATAPTGGEDAQTPPVEGRRSNGLYYGLAISSDGTVYAAQGAHDTIATLKLSPTGDLSLTGSIQAQHGDFPAGLALDDAGLLYVANNAVGEDDPFKASGSVAIYDPAAKKELGRYVFSSSYGGTSNFPYGITVLHSGAKTYVASERDDCVYSLDTRNPVAPRLSRKIPTGAHPVAVLLSRAQDRLYVANSLSDTVSIVDTVTDHVIGDVMLRPDLVRDIPGVTPTALALSADQETLYATLSDMNAVAVINTRTMDVSGYIPAGWYPSALALTPDGNRLLVANAKGLKARTPNPRFHSIGTDRTDYILTILQGNVISLAIPTGSDLQASTEAVIKDNRLEPPTEPPVNPLASIGLAAGKIKHVIYVIKENRTYDQVLGDLPQGNGDPSLVLFGRNVTPNLHALAERFVLLDNLYAAGEVSGDGWVWSTQGMANAFVARNVPYNYSGRGRKFDFEAQNNGYITGGFPATDSNGKPLATNPAFTDGAPPIADVASTNRTLWDVARGAGLSIRNYGFFLSYNTRSQGVAGGPDNYPAALGLQPPGHDLAGITDIDFRRFDLDYADSDAPNNYFNLTGDKNFLFAKPTYGQANMPSRFSEWNREFQMMLAKSPGGSAVPALMMVRFMTDHTSGARGGKHSPAADVADNDYAVGQLVDAVSHSPIWDSTAIFVIEDDAQNGPDHVDAHRTTGYIISPWIKAASVDHRFYNTDSFLKTIESLLGLNPLSQYDAVAEPVMDWDTAAANAAPYHAIPPAKELMSQINPRPATMSDADPRKKLAEKSESMDFTHADAAPAGELNQIIWQTIKGSTTPMPAPRGVKSDGDDD
jgi:YVTN family beta-propeller protein